MLSPLPFANKIEYFINTKLQTKIPDDLKHDITCALFEFAVQSEKVLHNEKEQWKNLYLKKVNEK